MVEQIASVRRPIESRRSAIFSPTPESVDTAVEWCALDVRRCSSRKWGEAESDLVALVAVLQR